jgi:hypothetical protein
LDAEPPGSASRRALQSGSRLRAGEHRGAEGLDMGFMKLLSRFSDPRPTIEQTIRIQVSCFEMSKNQHPDRDANAWLALALSSRAASGGQLSIQHFAATPNVSLISEPPVAMGICLYLQGFYRKFPDAWLNHGDGVPHFEVIQEYRHRYNDAATHVAVEPDGQVRRAMAACEPMDSRPISGC